MQGYDDIFSRTYFLFYTIVQSTPFGTYTRGKTIRGNGPTELTIIGFIALHAELLRAIPETLLRSGTFRNRCATAVPVLVLFK